MRKSYQVIWITLISFGLYFIIDELYFHSFREWINNYIGNIGVSHVLVYFIVGLPIFIGTIILHKFNRFRASLGLNGSLPTALLFGLACTLPMFVGYSLAMPFNSSLSLNTIMISVISAAFFEELYFRSFLFGQLYRYTPWGFLPAVLLGAIIFGIVHLYQGNGWGEVLGVFLITFFGGILFAWVYAEWHFNIWIPIFLHLLMNLSWEMFDVSESALGGWYANICRALTIALIIFGTIYYKRGKREPMEIAGKKWMLKSE